MYGITNVGYYSFTYSLEDSSGSHAPQTVFSVLRARFQEQPATMHCSKPACPTSRVWGSTNRMRLLFCVLLNGWERKPYNRHTLNPRWREVHDRYLEARPFVTQNAQRQIPHDS